VTEVKAEAGTQLTEQMKIEFLRRYDKDDALQKSVIQQPTPHRLINRLQRRRHEVLRFMADIRAVCISV
jgi:hypothetical protein